MTQHALDHGGDLRGRAAPQSGMDAHRTALDVPVDHHPAPAVAGVPLGHQVPVEGAEELAVRSAGGRALTPDPGVTRGERVVDHTPGRIAKRVGADVTAANVEQLFVAEVVASAREALTVPPAK